MCMVSGNAKSVLNPIYDSGKILSDMIEEHSAKLLAKRLDSIEPPLRIDGYAFDNLHVLLL